MSHKRQLKELKALEGKKIWFIEPLDNDEGEFSNIILHFEDESVLSVAAFGPALHLYGEPPEEPYLDLYIELA